MKIRKYSYRKPKSWNFKKYLVNDKIIVYNKKEHVYFFRPLTLREERLNGSGM